VKRANGQTETIALSSEGASKLGPGDQITISIKNSTERVYVRGAITKPGLIPFTPGMTLTQAIAEGAPLADAQLNRVKLQRRDSSGKLRSRVINAEKIIQGGAADEPLIAGDIIEIPYPSASYSFGSTSKLLSIGLLLYFLFR
jgi:protein involved in polysaccharide export with SLBB domain